MPVKEAESEGLIGFGSDCHNFPAEKRTFPSPLRISDNKSRREASAPR